MIPSKSDIVKFQKTPQDTPLDLGFSQHKAVPVASSLNKEGGMLYCSSCADDQSGTAQSLPPPEGNPCETSPTAHRTCSLWPPRSTNSYGNCTNA
eukprot:3235658-Amphidinium_carterae.1